jgi:DNA polymerase (family 10)
MTKEEVAQVLEEIGELLDIKGENPFKVRAYHNAARALAGTDRDIGDLVETGDLRTIKGIGEGIAEKIAELVRTAISVLRG